MQQVIDLLQIPGTWERPARPVRQVSFPEIGRTITHPGEPARKVQLRADGEADWQYWDGHWSSSGHWKIVKGRFLSIYVVNPDPIAQQRGDVGDEFYYKIMELGRAQLTLAVVPGQGERIDVWKRKR